MEMFEVLVVARSFRYNESHDWQSHETGCDSKVIYYGISVPLQISRFSHFIIDIVQFGHWKAMQSQLYEEGTEWVLSYPNLCLADCYALCAGRKYQARR